MRRRRSPFRTTQVVDPWRVRGVAPRFRLRARSRVPGSRRDGSTQYPHRRQRIRELDCPKLFTFQTPKPTSFQVPFTERPTIT